MGFHFEAILLYFLMASHDIQFDSFQISGKILPHSFLVSKDGRKLAVGC